MLSSLFQVYFIDRFGAPKNIRQTHHFEDVCDAIKTRIKVHKLEDLSRKRFHALCSIISLNDYIRNNKPINSLWLDICNRRYVKYPWSLVTHPALTINAPNAIRSHAKVFFDPFLKIQHVLDMIWYSNQSINTIDHNGTIDPFIFEIDSIFYMAH